MSQSFVDYNNYYTKDKRDTPTVQHCALIDIVTNIAIVSDVTIC